VTDLPTGWEATTIGAVTLPFESGAPGIEPDNTFCYIDISSIDNSRQVIAGPKILLGRDAPSRARRIVETGDILFSTVRTYLKNIAMVPPDFDGAYTSTGIAVLRPSGAIHPRYLFHWVCSPPFIEAMSKAQDGTLYPAVTDSDVASGNMPLPPLAEQRRIVAKLDALTARTARARADLDRIPALAARYKQAVLSQMFAPENLDAKAVPFFDVLDFKGGSQPPKSTFTPTPGPGRVRLLQIRDFGNDDKAVYIRDERRWPQCDADDIMVGRYGASVGKILTGKAGAYNVALVKILYDKRVIDRLFLYFWLQSSTFQTALSSVSRSAQDGFNKGDLESIFFPLVDVERQHAAAAKAVAALAEIDRLTAEATAARRLLERLDQAILAKAFRGELVPQDPADEPASVLLARIKAARAAAPTGARRGRKAKAACAT
jgi:type I restriction enzyme S subunit